MDNENNEEEINRKRKNFFTHNENRRCKEGVGEEKDDQEKNGFLDLDLTLMFRSTTRPRLQSPENNNNNNNNLPSLSLPPPPLYLQVQSILASTPPIEASPQVQSARRPRKSSRVAREGMNEAIPPPFPWATSHRATVHSLEYLLSKQLFKISGEVQCKRCERKYQMEFDLKEKFLEIGSYIAENKSAMRDRAPDIWMNPILPTCQFCKQENSVKPVVCADKSNINWLFLLLGKMLGCCTLDELKYFCEHTKNHRTGAKDRVLYLAYLTLCKQLDPNGPFDR
ncbi:hypothetical protein P3S67_001951 [Capsicum chacoense]